MDNYGMIFAGMLAMALFGGLIVFLIIRPWLRPMRRGWEASHETIAENFHLSAAQVRRQTAEEQNRATQAAITAEQTRARLIEAQAENDQAEKNRHREALRQDDADEQIQEVENAIKIEEARARLRLIRLQNEQSTPPPWKMKRQYIKFAVILAVLFILTTIASIYFSK